MEDGLDIKTILYLIALPIAFMAFVGIIALIYYKAFTPLFAKLEDMDKKSNKGKNIDLFWPDIKDAETATIVARKNGKIYYVLAVLIGSMSLFQFLGYTWWGLVYALIFTIVGFGIHKMSRFAAIAGVIFYFFPTIYAVISGHIIIVNVAITVLFMLSFINAIRATFKYHILKEIA